MFGIGETELVLILLFAFMIFGPDKLPGMGKTLGRALRQFRNAQEGFTQVVQTEIVDPATEAMSDNPKKPNRKRVEFDEDADIEGGEEGAAAKRTETFAERKKRLEAERKAREAAEKQAAEAEEVVDLPEEPVEELAEDAPTEKAEPVIPPEQQPKAQPAEAPAEEAAPAEAAEAAPAQPAAEAAPAAAQPEEDPRQNDILPQD